MLLEEYNKKRDFDETSEPKNGSGTNDTKLSFVVQKHDASHLHYDFRLEADGVLKSWAVPKGPSLDPSVKRLAMMVEDHPLEYRNFEGRIPKGNYGAGEVIIWDEGFYEPIGEAMTKKRQERIIKNGIKNGAISFYLFGKKLQGEFSLIKLKNSNENSWLLLKKNDVFANNDNILKKTASVRSGKRIEDLKDAGDDFFNDMIKTYSLKKKPLPTEIIPMLAKTAENPFDDGEWIFELKWDGYRAIAQVHGEKVRIYSRNGKEFNFPQIEQALKSCKNDVVLDGEIVALDSKGKPSFQLLQNFLQFGEKAPISFVVFDILFFDGYDVTVLPLLERKKILEKIIDATGAIRLSDYVIEKGKDLFTLVEKENLEGIVAKDAMSTYQKGIRSSAWLKIKNEKRQEIIVCGYTRPRGSRKYIGALIMGIFRNGMLKFAGHINPGSSEARNRKLKAMLDAYVSEHCPFETVPKTNKPAIWLKPEIVAEVAFSGVTQDGIYRHAKFLGIRFDKFANEAREEVNFEKNGAHISEKIHNDGTKEIEISNPKKIFWPQEHIKKIDVVHYYESIAPYILPHLIDRPESLHRFPDGINGQQFYQKHQQYLPKWIESINIFSEGEDRTIHYMLCQDKKTLLYMANLGCIEMHPWLSRKNSLDFPDFLVIDLDPLNIGFEKVVETALATKKFLDQLHLSSFVKTSGATGMHIYLPLGAKYSYDQSKDFGRLISMRVHQMLPEITSIERMPKKRNKKVYIDVYQNRKGQTVAAPYSLRPFPNATVSTPLFWDELNEKINPSMFTIKTIHLRLGLYGDIWEELLQSEGIDMEAAIEKIEKTKFSRNKQPRNK